MLNPQEQPYKYNGKEFDTMHGLNMYDYGARHYDAAIMRWHVPDALAEKYYSISPYAYCANNPVNFIDPDGTSFTKYETEDSVLIATTNDGNPNTVVVPDDKLQAFVWGITHTSPEVSSQPEWNLMWQQYMGAVDKRTDLQVWTLSMVHSDASREAHLNYWRTGEGRMKAMFTEIGAQWTDPEVLVMSAAGAVAGLSGMRMQGGKGGMKAANGIEINGFAKHGLNRAIERGVKPGAILDAVKNPLKTGNIVTDQLGRQSQRFIGRYAEVVVNPQTGQIISVNPTSSNKAANLLKLWQ
jgi:RHS repeat-associated protein